jgi:hypothetical protein
MARRNRLHLDNSYHPTHVGHRSHVPVANVSIESPGVEKLSEEEAQISM